MNEKIAKIGEGNYDKIKALYLSIYATPVSKAQ
jgi:hypothetical protein